MATTHSNKIISLSFFDLMASQIYISDYLSLVIQLASQITQCINFASQLHIDFHNLNSIH